jgi:hypothetical protein
VTRQDVEDLERLARIVAALRRDVDDLRRRFVADRIDFEDRTVDALGSIKYRFVHNFGRRVRWWVTDWQGASGASLSRHADSTDHVLILTSKSAGVATIRVEVAG